MYNLLLPLRTDTHSQAIEINCIYLRKGMELHFLYIHYTSAYTDSFTQIRYNIYCFSIIQFVFQISFVHFSKCQPSSTSAISVSLSAYVCVCHVFFHVGLSERAILLYQYVVLYRAPWFSVRPENVLQIHFTSSVLVVMVRLLLAGMAACYSNGLRTRTCLFVVWLSTYTNTNHRGIATSSQAIYPKRSYFLHFEDICTYIYFRGIFALLHTFNARWELRCLCVYFIITFILQA